MRMHGENYVERSSENAVGCNTALVCTVRRLVIGNGCLAGAQCRLRPRQKERSRPFRLMRLVEEVVSLWGVGGDGGRL